MRITADNPRCDRRVRSSWLLSHPGEGFILVLVGPKGSLIAQIRLALGRTECKKERNMGNRRADSLHVERRKRSGGREGGGRRRSVPAPHSAPAGLNPVSQSHVWPSQLHRPPSGRPESCYRVIPEATFVFIMTRSFCTRSPIHPPSPLPVHRPPRRPTCHTTNALPLRRKSPRSRGGGR
jgi:hypothetical protein